MKKRRREGYTVGILRFQEIEVPKTRSMGFILDANHSATYFHRILGPTIYLLRHWLFIAFSITMDFFHFELNIGVVCGVRPEDQQWRFMKLHGNFRWIFFMANSPHQVAGHVTPRKKSDISIYTPPGVTPAGSRNQPTPARSGATARCGGGVEVGNINKKKMLT